MTADIPLSFNIKDHPFGPEYRSSWKGRLTRGEIIYFKRKILKDQGFKCFYCAASIREKAILEHKTPICRGGDSRPENLCVSCVPCDTLKGRMTADEYRIVVPNPAHPPDT